MSGLNGFNADLELDELQNAIDRGSGGITPAQRQLNAQFNLGLIALAGNASGGAQQSQAVAEIFVVNSSTFTMQNISTVQKVFGNSANGAVTLGVGTYAFEAQYMISDTGTTAHSWGVGFGGTAVLNFIGYCIFGNNAAAATPATGGVTGFASSAANITATPASAAAASFSTIDLQGAFKVTTAGTFIPQVTASAAPGAAPTLVAGSYIFIQPLAGPTIGNWS